MLLETDCDLDELRLIDKQRIESLALENDVPAYVTTVRLLEDVEENTSLKLVHRVVFLSRMAQTLRRQRLPHAARSSGRSRVRVP